MQMDASAELGARETGLSCVSSQPSSSCTYSCTIGTWTEQPNKSNELAYIEPQHNGDTFNQSRPNLPRPVISARFLSFFLSFFLCF